MAGKKELTDLGKFNNNLDKLFTALETAYPDDPELPYYKDKICMARQVNSRMVAEQFMEMATPYIDQIMSQNVDFFMNLSLNGLVEDNSYVKLVKKIKVLWETMSLTSQEQIWKYFQVFVTLSIKITKRFDLLPVINKYRQIPLHI